MYETGIMQNQSNSPKLRRSITLVTDIAFWERTYGSHTRIRTLARYLAETHDLTIFCLRSLKPQDESSFSDLLLPNAKLISYDKFKGPNRKIRKKIRNLEFFKGAREDFVSALHAYFQQTPPDIVIFEYIKLGYLLDACPTECLTVLDMHDVMSERMMSLASVGLKASISLSMVAEKQILEAFDRVLTISRADQLHVENHMELENAIYVPCSVEEQPVSEPATGWGSALRHWGTIAKKPAPHEPTIRDASGCRLLFIGASSPVNIEGLKWFLEQVWPILLPHGFTLDVVGNVGNAFTTPVDSVHIHGRQDDLEPFYKSANIAINPVFVGGGLKIKCIDALAAAIPCVTTSEGASGLHMAQYAGIFVAHNRSQFARHLLQLAGDTDLRDRISVLGPQFIQDEFSHETAYSRLNSWINSPSGSVGN